MNAQIGTLVQFFSGVNREDIRISDEIKTAIVEQMELAATEDDNAPAGDPAARGGKWHRAANIVNAKMNRYAEDAELDAPLFADWSWSALMEAVGVSKDRIEQDYEHERAQQRG